MNLLVNVLLSYYHFRKDRLYHTPYECWDQSWCQSTGSQPIGELVMTCQLTPINIHACTGLPKPGTLCRQLAQSHNAASSQILYLVPVTLL